MSSPIAIDGSFAFTKREAQMYKNRSLKSKFNLKEVVIAWVKSFIWAALFSLALLGWMIAADKGSCTVNYHSGVEICQ